MYTTFCVSRETADRFITVSYTHLDVYKRQVYFSTSRWVGADESLL